MFWEGLAQEAAEVASLNYSFGKGLGEIDCCLLRNTGTRSSGHDIGGMSGAAVDAGLLVGRLLLQELPGTGWALGRAGCPPAIPAGVPGGQRAGHEGICHAEPAALVAGLGLSGAGAAVCSSASSLPRACAGLLPGRPG